MAPNISNIDRVLRLIFFILSIFLFVFDLTEGWIAYTLIIAGTVFLITSLLSFCPIYKAFGWNSRKKN